MLGLTVKPLELSSTEYPSAAARPAVVMDSFPTPDLLKELLVSCKVIDKVKASTDSRICHDDLGTDDQNYQKPIRSVRGL